MIEAVEKLAKSIGVAAACQALGVPRSSLYRVRQPEKEPRARPTPERALSEEEKVQVRQALNGERFQDSSPRQVYATLLDEGVYLCHWRTMYRILAEHDQVRERRNQLQHPTYSKPELLATGAKSALELGHHQAQRAAQVDLLLPVRYPGCLQPLRAGLASDRM